VAIALAAVIAGAAILLVVAGRDGSQTSPRDETGDVSVEGGRQNPEETDLETPEEISLADIEFAEVRADGSDIVFEARSTAEIPKTLDGRSMSWRWEVLDGEEPAWILSANLDIGPNATIFNPSTDFGAGTADGSFPGRIERDGRSLIIRMDPSRLEGFPDEFEWKLKTTLDAGQGDAGSALATDSAPEEGVGRFTGQ
jgi:hypothetical protein